MLNKIWVIGNLKGKGNAGRVILWERHPDHPNGEVVISNDGRSYEVAETSRVKALIGEEKLLRSEARVGWNSKTEAGFVKADVPELRPATDSEEDAARPPLRGEVEKQTARVPKPRE